MKEVSAGIPGRRTAWLAPTLVALATIAVFSGALRNGFLNWDDNVNFLTNPHYRGLGWANLRWMFTTLHLGPYQPLSWLTCALDYLLWGMNPIGYHLTNVLLHAANAVLPQERRDHLGRIARDDIDRIPLCEIVDQHRHLFKWPDVPVSLQQAVPGPIWYICPVMPKTISCLHFLPKKWI